MTTSGSILYNSRFYVLQVQCTIEMSLYGFRTQKQRKRWRLRITISQHYSTEHIIGRSWVQSLAASYQKTLKGGSCCYPVWRSTFERDRATSTWRCSVAAGPTINWAKRISKKDFPFRIFHFGQLIIIIIIIIYYYNYYYYYYYYYMCYVRHGRTFTIQEDDTKSADFTPSSRVVNIHPHRDTCTMRAQRDRLTSGRLSHVQPTQSKSHWLCSHENESRSERCFGSRSKTWLGSWFELRAFTCIANAFPITIRICALQGNILFLLRSPCWWTHAWLQHGFSAHFQNAHARIMFRKSFAFTCPRIRLSTRITIQNALFSRFKTRFKSLIWNSFAFTRAQIRKGPNHVPKRLSKRDSFSCEQAQWYFASYLCYPAWVCQLAPSSRYHGDCSWSRWGTWTWCWRCAAAPRPSTGGSDHCTSCPPPRRKAEGARGPGRWPGHWRCCPETPCYRLNQHCLLGTGWGTLEMGCLYTCGGGGGQKKCFKKLFIEKYLTCRSGISFVN